MDERDIISPSTEPGTPALRLLPLHDVAHPAPVVRRRPGRPRKVELRPTITDLEHHATVAVERERFIAADPLVTAVINGEDTRTILRVLISQIVREAAALEFQRLEAEKRGRDGAQISSRRVDALKKVAEIELKLRELDGEQWNLRAERFQKLFALWAEKLVAIATEVLPAEMRDIYMNRIATAFEGWEESASEQIR
jgi:hypothetical protein